MIQPDSRYGSTRKKMISLTEEGRAQLQQYADAHDMSFSAAIESLALIGMKADLSALLTPLINSSVEKGLQRHFNRLAKLSLLAAAEAAMAHDVSTMLLLQTVRQEAVRHPADFEERIPVSHDKKDALDARIRALYNRMRRLARQRQQRLLKRPLTKLLADYAPERLAAAEGGRDA